MRTTEGAGLRARIIRMTARGDHSIMCPTKLVSKLDTKCETRIYDSRLGSKSAISGSRGGPPSTSGNATRCQQQSGLPAVSTTPPMIPQTSLCSTKIKTLGVGRYVLSLQS